MDEFEELRSDVDQLKQQMTSIMEILQALQMKALERTPTREQPITLHLNRHGQHADLAQAYPYGLPPDYTPPIANTTEPTQPRVEVLIPTNQPVHSMPPINHNMIQATEEVPMACSNEQLQMLEERSKAVEGSNYGMAEAADLCLVLDVIIPSKFKALEFDKYKGTSHPKSQLTMHCRKMATHALSIVFRTI